MSPSLYRTELPCIGSTSGSGAGDRTPILDSKDRCPTVGRPPNTDSGRRPPKGPPDAVAVGAGCVVPVLPPARRPTRARRVQRDFTEQTSPPRAGPERIRTSSKRFVAPRPGIEPGPPAFAVALPIATSAAWGRNQLDSPVSVAAPLSVYPGVPPPGCRRVHALSDVGDRDRQLSQILRAGSRRDRQWSRRRGLARRSDLGWTQLRPSSFVLPSTPPTLGRSGVPHFRFPV